MTFTDAFFDALGRWQRGWNQDPAVRKPIAAALVKEALKLPIHFRTFNGILYRKRHLYRSEKRRELRPLFIWGVLDEGCPTSWTMKYEIAELYDEVFDLHDKNAAAGSIFAHTPKFNEVILNIPSLWNDHTFVAAADAYQKAGGKEAKALFNFHVANNQHEVIMKAPLRVDEIVTLSGKIEFKGIYVSQSGTSNVIQNVLKRSEYLRGILTPNKYNGMKGTLEDTFNFGKAYASRSAKFLGWRKLRGRDRIMEARWTDGTFAYRRLDGAMWLNLNNPAPEVR